MKRVWHGQQVIGQEKGEWLGYGRSVCIYMVPTSMVTRNSIYFPGYFQVKAMKSQVNLALNQYFLLII